MVVLLLDAWRKGKGGLRSCGGWCMGFQVRVLAEGWLEGEGREFRECQLWAEWDCGGASRWALCVDNTVWHKGNKGGLMGPAGSRSSTSLGKQPELQGPSAHRPLLWRAQLGLPGWTGMPNLDSLCHPIMQRFIGNLVLYLFTMNETHS